MPARALLSMLASLPRRLPKDAEATLRVDGRRLILTCGQAVMRVPLLPLEDYPTLPSNPGEHLWTLNAGALAGARRVLVAVGRDDTLPVLTGALFAEHDGRLEVAATDRYRLAVQNVDVAAPGNLRMLIPAQVLAWTSAMDGDVTFARDQDMTDPGASGEVILTAGTRILRTRLLDGEFPKYRALMPEADSGSGGLALDRDAFVEVVRQGSAGVRAGWPGGAPVRLRLDNATALTVESGDPDDDTMTSSAATVEAEVSGNVPVLIAVNPTYMRQALDALPAGPVTYEHHGPLRPMMLTAEDAPGFRQLLMPVRLHPA